MTVIEQYRRDGLSRPIRIRAGFGFHSILWGGGGFLLTGAVLMMEEGGVLEQVIGLFGFAFFGLACSILLVAWLRGGRRGLVEISEAGLFLSHIGVVLPWEDLGPAWVHTVRQKGMALKDVTFVLRNASRHMDRMGPLGRFLFSLSRAVSRSRRGGAVDWGVRAALGLVEAGYGTHRQMDEALEMMRTAVLDQPDAIVSNVPVPLRLGLGAEDLVAILNAEVLARRETPSPLAGRETNGDD